MFIHRFLALTYHFPPVSSLYKHSVKQCTQSWNKVIQKQCRSCYPDNLRKNCPIKDVRWYITINVWYTHNWEWKLIFLVKHFIYKLFPTDFYIWVQESCMFLKHYEFDIIFLREKFYADANKCIICVINVFGRNKMHTKCF